MYIQTCTLQHLHRVYLAIRICLVANVLSLSILRQVLSRAFRNRFVELHFDELPAAELETILHDRCQIPLSHCKKLIAVMLELQVSHSWTRCVRAVH